MEELHTERDQLIKHIYSLECSDEMLFINNNGNYDLYKSMQALLCDINKLIKEKETKL